MGLGHNKTHFMPNEKLIDHIMSLKIVKSPETRVKRRELRDQTLESRAER